jgi:hypothetical protein
MRCKIVIYILGNFVSYYFEILFQESADNVDPNSSSSKDALLEEACKKYAEATRLCPTLYDVSSSLFIFDRNSSNYRRFFSAFWSFRKKDKKHQSHFSNSLRNASHLRM